MLWLNIVLGDDNGLYVVDDGGIERLRIGQYETGKYGSKAVRVDSKLRVIQDSANGFLIQKNTGTISVPVWTDQFYVDSNGVLTANEMVTDKIKIKSGSDTLIDASTKTIDFSKFTTKLGNITASNIDATNLHISSANIDGILTASQINIKGTSISNNGQTTFAVDNSGNVTMMGNITMNGGNINWGNVSKPSYTASEVGARPNTWTPTASQVGAISSTYIDANGVWTGYINANTITSGTISADRINGGTISGVTINVSTDVNMGKVLYLNSGSFTAGIKFMGNDVQIYHDPVAKALHLSAVGGVWAGSNRIDENIIAKFG